MIQQFKGTRNQCFNWLWEHGFELTRLGWQKPNWKATVTYDGVDDGLGEVANWQEPRFVVRTMEIEI